MNYKRLAVILCLIIPIILSAELLYSFTELAHYDPDNFSKQGKAYDVAISEDSLIFTAFGDAGLYVHKLEDSQLVYLAHIRDEVFHRNLMIACDGSILSADNFGIHAYRYSNNNFYEIAYLDTSMQTYRMIQGPDSTIYVANGSYGLYAFKYCNDEFNFLSSFNCGGSVRSITLRSDGRILLACYQDGIRICDFNGSSFINRGRIVLSLVTDVVALSDTTYAACGD